MLSIALPYLPSRVILLDICDLWALSNRDQLVLCINWSNFLISTIQTWTLQSHTDPKIRGFWAFNIATCRFRFFAGLQNYSAIIQLLFYGLKFCCLMFCHQFESFNVQTVISFRRLTNMLAAKDNMLHCFTPTTGAKFKASIWVAKKQIIPEPFLRTQMSLSLPKLKHCKLLILAESQTFSFSVWAFYSSTPDCAQDHLPVLQKSHYHFLFILLCK